MLFETPEIDLIKTLDPKTEAWTLDQVDDKDVGVRSTALLFGSQTGPILSGFATAFVGGLWAAGSMAGLGSPYFATVGIAAAHVAWQVRNSGTRDHS